MHALYLWHGLCLNKGQEAPRNGNRSTGEDTMTEQEALAILQLSPFFYRLSPTEQEELLQDFCRHHGKKEPTATRNFGQPT